MAMASLKKYLIVNPGSASRKYALYQSDEEISRVHFEKENNSFVATYTWRGQKKRQSLTLEDYQNAPATLISFWRSVHILESSDEIAAVGFRIVAPRHYFLKTRPIDDEYLRLLRETKEMAPLHIVPALSEIQSWKTYLPSTLFIGVSDSGFHNSLPDESHYYALPFSQSRFLEVERFGYHGISVQSVLRKAQRLMRSLPPKIIVCHLGSGSSITAIKDGKSLDTSMGFTPLEGLPMGTRIGNIDAGALLFLGKKLNFDFDTLDDYLNTKCGLLGLSGKTADVRELIELEKTGDKDAARALNFFVYHIKKYIGAYIAALGGLDLLIFTATIGERSAIIRSRVCQGLQALGILIDERKNLETIERDGFIDNGSLPVKIAVLQTEEMKEMAREIQRNF